MGLNAYFAYTVVIGMGYSWEYALTAVFAEGIIFILLSVTNVREAIFNAIPKNLKSAVSVGIGLFIAFVGLQNAHIVMGGATLVELFSLDGYNQLNGVSATMNDIGITVILALVGILITGIACNQECERKYSLGYFDHMGNRYCLSVRQEFMFRMQKLDASACFRISVTDYLFQVLHRFSVNFSLRESLLWTLL